MIEVIEIGAGSSARVDRRGLLKVGLDSGEDPGPACYNLGGHQPAVTDADLLLGYSTRGLLALDRLDGYVLGA